MKETITACAFLHKDGLLFIAKRADTKKFLPGKFELPGGHIEAGEDTIEGLKREFREEFGIDIVVGQELHRFTYMTGGEQVVEVDYLAELADAQGVIRINPKDHSEFRWVTQEQVDEVWEKTDAEYAAIQKGFDIILRK